MNRETKMLIANELARLKTAIEQGDKFVREHEAELADKRERYRQLSEDYGYDPFAIDAPGMRPEKMQEEHALPTTNSRGYVKLLAKLVIAGCLFAAYLFLVLPVLERYLGLSEFEVIFSAIALVSAGAAADWFVE